MLKAKCFAVSRRDSGDDCASSLIMLAALNRVSESPPGFSGGPADSGVSVLRRQAGGMQADTMPESDGSRLAETSSATVGGVSGCSNIGDVIAGRQYNLSRRRQKVLV